MQKVLIAILGIAVVGGGILLLTHSPSSDESTVTTQQTSEQNQEEYTEVEESNLKGSGSLAQLFGKGENIRCEFNSTIEGQSSSGVFYTDGERFRVDAVHTTSEGTITSNIINDGEYAYTWGDTPNGTIGIKTPHTNMDTSVDSYGEFSAQDEGSYVDIDEQVTYDCDRWNVDASVFVPPSTIEFMDMETMMREMMQGMPEGFKMPEVY